MQGWTALHYTAAYLTRRSEKLPLAETLIGAGADVNAQDEQVPLVVFERLQFNDRQGWYT